MKRFTLRRELLLLLCGALIFSACQKEVGPNEEHQVEEGLNEQRLTIGGVIEDSPERIAEVPKLIFSQSGIIAAPAGKGGGGGRIKDADGDGIPDSSDGCPTSKETMNGYQDTDGCPDTPPAPVSTDTDSDGIPDTTDACDTQKETFNGYQDGDGCPDTIPDSDNDGIDDLKDACPSSPETMNGFEDTDGCPDTVPVIVPPVTLPVSYRLQMPVAGSQGSEGNCVTFALVYGMRSAEEYYKSGASSFNYSTNIFSPEFVYNQVKMEGSCAAGSSVIMTLEFLKNTGVPTWDIMPYSSTNGCSILPSTSQTAAAANYKIKSYSRVASNDLTSIKTLIVNKHPMIATFSINGNFEKASATYVWNSYAAPTYASHAVAICGYDDTKKAFLALNSWGPSWGDNGYIWIGYDYLPQLTNDLYVMGL